MKNKLRTILGPAIVLVTVAAFVYYLKTHPETVDQIRSLPPLLILVLLGLYIVVFTALLILNIGQLMTYGKRMGWQENALFNAYSMLINFFGPGQSGPAFRGVYLKKKHDLGYKKYLFVTLIYYAFYAVLSALMMFVGTRPWWQTLLLMAGVGAVSGFVLRLYRKRSKQASGGGMFTPLNLGIMLGATVLQLTTLAAIYFVELNNVGANASFGQVLAYTGVSNFALFAALTPGSIGIREAFLVFSQNLHGIDSSTIIAANVIDRSVYLIFLGLLFVLVLSLHAKNKLGLKSLKGNGESA
ncbi:flippase-like domain-containing protein [Candidatus Saccharibacteria bacterium]|jgi:Predicted integral membrane protein|nr:flippase-like domain-containing protein [Candidatus Saccharibacteria bacterium]